MTASALAVKGRVITVCAMLLLLSIGSPHGALASLDAFRPVGWQELLPDGTLMNPHMAYDNDLGDITTKCDINSDYYAEGVAFFFEPGTMISSCEVFYTWTTSGCGLGIECPSHARLYLFRWGDATWEIERWVGSNEPLLERSLVVSEEYVGPQGQVSVLCEAIAGRGMPGPGPGEFPVYIDLYDLYIRAVASPVERSSWGAIKAMYR
jgi:hypothetical protein